MVARIPNKVAALATICAALLIISCRAKTQRIESWESWTPTSSLPSNPEQSAKSGEIKDHIVAMLIAASIDKNGRVVNPKFTFDPTEAQITVIVQVGKITNAPLDIVWYQVTDNGDQKLFEHQVPVTSYDRAYSVGKNAGTLSPGEYKVTATLEGETKELAFDVASQKALAPPAQKGTTPPGKAPDPPPVDGGSGKMRPAKPPATPPSASECVIELMNWNGSDVSDSAPKVDLIVEHTKCFFSVEATVDGPTSTVATFLEYDAGRTFLYIDPCSLSGGKDLPGTKVRIDTDAHDNTSVYTEKQGMTAGPYVVTLGDDTQAPRLDVKSKPARGKVNTGDKISLKVRSYEVRNGGPWQSGVMDIQVIADPGGLVTSKDYLQYRGKACGEKSWEQNLDATYTVPSNPPPIIKLCALTHDFAGNPNTKCGEFRTGNTWKGKLHLVSSIASSDYGLLCNNETFNGEFSFVVAPNGQVQGKGSAHEVAPPQCNFHYPPPAMQTEFEVKGIAVRGASDWSKFQLSFAQTGGFSKGYAIATFLWDPSSLSVMHTSRSPEDFTVPVIAPGDAEAQVSNSMTGPHYTYKGQMTVTMLCEDCK